VQDTFINKNCYVYCWREGLIDYVIELACFLYSFRDLSAVHVKAQTLPLMGKSAVQVFLTVLSNTLQTLYFPLTPATSFDICLPHYNFLQYVGTTSPSHAGYKWQDTNTLQMVKVVVQVQ